MEPETVAAILADDPRLQERLARELRRCIDPEMVLWIIEHFRESSRKPLSDDDLLRAVTKAVDRMALPPIERRKRMKGFLVVPEDVLQHPAIAAMNAYEFAAFTRLWLEAWRQPDPGILLDNDNALARLAGYGPSEWATVRDSVERAFDTASRPGSWVFSSMRRALAAQDAYYVGKSIHGKNGVDERERKRAKRRSPKRVKQSLSDYCSENPSIRDSEYQKDRGSRNDVPMQVRDDGRDER